MSATLEYLRTLLGEPWAIATVVVSGFTTFVLWLFREVIKEVVLGRLKSRREKADKLAGYERLLNAGEREILSKMAMAGGKLRVSMRDVMSGRNDPLTVTGAGVELRLQIGTREDVFSLSRRKYLDNGGSKLIYRLTEKGLATGEDLIRLFGLENREASPP